MCHEVQTGSNTPIGIDPIILSGRNACGGKLKIGTCWENHKDLHWFTLLCFACTVCTLFISKENLVRTSFSLSYLIYLRAFFVIEICAIDWSRKRTFCWTVSQSSLEMMQSLRRIINCTALQFGTFLNDILVGHRKIVLFASQRVLKMHAGGRAGGKSPGFFSIFLVNRGRMVTRTKYEFDGRQSNWNKNYTSKEQIAFPGFFPASLHRKISGKYDAGGWRDQNNFSMATLR